MRVGSPIRIDWSVMRNLPIPAPALLAVLSISGLCAQTGESRPAFEVVSIKPLEKGQRPGPPKMDPGRVNYPNTSLKSLIMRAYKVKNYQLTGPSWLDEWQPYSFSAKIPDGASQEQVPEMLQGTLADRFGLKVHWESQIQSVYALVAGKGGPKLKATDLSTAPTGQDGKPARIIEFSTAGHSLFRATTMAQFAEALSVQVGQPVLDMTGIEGIFDIEINVNPADLAGMRKIFAGSAEFPTDDSPFSSIFTAMQTLGLKLESRKAPVDHLIIDHALRVPTEN
jgi:uncharacterized protein (TIGR03435 family)